MLTFLEKVSQDPDAVTAADAQAVRDAGVADQAIEDALHVLATFETIVRLADAFEFHVPSAQDFHAMGKMLLRRGYE